MSLRYLMLVGLMALGYGSVQGMLGGGDMNAFLQTEEGRTFVKDTIVDVLTGLMPAGENPEEKKNNIKALVVQLFTEHQHAIVGYLGQNKMAIAGQTVNLLV